MWIASYVLVIPFAWRGFLFGEHSPFTSDIRHFHHPMTRAVVRALGEGHLPLWSDHTFLGFPLLADPQTALFYPGTLLPAALGPHWGYVLFLIAHSLVAAIGMFALMRSHGVENLGAWCAGLMVALSGYFAHEAQHPGLFAILCWIPTWLWTTHRFMRRPTPLGAIGAAAVVAMMMFAGTLQVLFGAIIFYGFYVIGLTVEIRARSGTDVAAKRFMLIFLVELLGLALAAVSLLPAVEHLPTTARALGMTYDFASMGSVHPVEWLGMFLNGSTRWLGAGLALDHEGASFYIGSLAVPLVVMGLLAKRSALSIWITIAVVTLIVVAMGRNGSLHPWLFEQSPGLVGGLRGMGRALGPAAVGIAFLAAVGIQRLAEGGARVDRLLWIGLAVVIAAHAVAFAMSGVMPTTALWSGGIAILALIASAAAGRFGSSKHESPADRSWVPVALAGLLVVDLVAFGALDSVVRANPSPPEANGVPDEVLELNELAGGAFDYQGERIMLHGFGPLNLPLLQGFDGVGGYNPLVSLQYLDFVNLINKAQVYPRVPIDQFVSGSKPQRFDSPLFDTASVRFVISNRPERVRGLRLVERYADTHLGSFGAALYENADAMPRAYLAYRTKRALGHADLEKLLTRRFNPRLETVVEGEGPALAGGSLITPVARTSTRPEHLSFHVATREPSVLVVTDSWHPGWRAWVDGRESPIFRVNAMFRGVAIPAGANEVEMRFEPRSFRAGAIVSLAALCVMAGLALLHARIRKRI